MSIKKQDIPQFQLLITQLIQELEASLQSDQADTVELDQSRVGRLSRMDALQGQQMGLAQKRRNEQRLKALNGALKRIDSGDFGYCFICGEEIGAKRLAFDPAATRCIDCVDAD